MTSSLSSRLAAAQAELLALKLGIVREHRLMAAQFRADWLTEHLEHGGIAVLPVKESIDGIPPGDLVRWACVCGETYTATKDRRLGGR